MTTLVRAAAEGDQRAWDALVARYQGLVWAVVRAHGLGGADAADVFQTTWLRLVEHLARLRDPASVGSWLATTARRECWRLRRRGTRERPTDVFADTMSSNDPPPENDLVRDEEHAALWRAFERISDRCRTLLRVLMADPPPSYEEVSAALDMPIGSIGPTRARCLGKLREVLSDSN